MKLPVGCGGVGVSVVMACLGGSVVSRLFRGSGSSAECLDVHVMLKRIAKLLAIVG